ncbi:uncharacterized protein V1510DRAFT_431092 [Dipodascopsis tothii]|uniref:uncharacterized protein n=1 Tax=Dipodascopsis tothii TaxID=44089 RepID=UPI0034CF8F20
MREIETRSLFSLLSGAPRGPERVPLPLPGLDVGEQLCGDDEADVTVVTGPPFSGKTRLLYQVCSAYRAHSAVVVIDVDGRFDVGGVALAAAAQGADATDAAEVLVVRVAGVAAAAAVEAVASGELAVRVAALAAAGPDDGRWHAPGALC